MASLGLYSRIKQKNRSRNGVDGCGAVTESEENHPLAALNATALVPSLKLEGKI
jgi:hypothetical protein